MVQSHHSFSSKLFGQAGYNSLNGKERNYLADFFGYKIPNTTVQFLVLASNTHLLTPIGPTVLMALRSYSPALSVYEAM